MILFVSFLQSQYVCASELDEQSIMSNANRVLYADKQDKKAVKRFLIALNEQETNELLRKEVQKLRDPLIAKKDKNQSDHMKMLHNINRLNEQRNQLICREKSPENIDQIDQDLKLLDENFDIMLEQSRKINSRIMRYENKLNYLNTIISCND